jgi:GNAT superfamily N-acetyltransferase
MSVVKSHLVVVVKESMMAAPSTGAVRPLGRVASPRVLTEHDVAAAAEVFAAAFMAEPGNAVLFPDALTRLRLMELTGRLVVERALPRATVHGIEVDGALAAVAVWDPPGVRPGLPPARTLPTVLRRTALIGGQLPGVAAPVRAHRRELIPLVRARRRAVRTASQGLSWHLGFLATAPDHQGRGLARLLMERVLRRCDADGLPAWLETTDPSNPPIYKRFGFDTVAHVEPAAWLPGLWVMRREPLKAPDRPR